MDRDEFLAVARRNPVNEIIADALLRLALPDAWIVAGCLAQTVWNFQTRRAADHGISDYDVFYYDSNTSWTAEDAIIRRLAGQLAPRGIRAEIRNQARVHLWYPEKHGLPYPPLHRSTDGIDRFLTRNTQFGMFRRHRRDDRAAKSGAEFFGRELRGKGCALESAMAGNHDTPGQCRIKNGRS